MLRMLIVIMMLLVLAIPVATAQEAPTLTLTPLGTYQTNIFDEGAAEIVAYHAGSQSLYVVNGNDETLDVLNISDPTSPTLTTQLELIDYGSPNSVDVYSDLIAVAVEAAVPQENGQVLFFNPAGELQQAVEVGAMPDMLTFTPDGSKVLTANEGEPSVDYSVDPEGSVSIIDTSTWAVTNVTFADFNPDGPRAAELNQDVRVYGLNATPAQDFEPEYIAVSPNSATAWVSLQENNAWAVIDINAGTIFEILPFGYKDHNQPGNGFDASSADGGINIANWPVYGIYQPDAMVAYEAADGNTYIVVANEGDTRDYETYSEETTVADETLDPEVFPNAADLQTEAQLGDLEITNTLGDTDSDGDLDALYLPGGRSFSIRAGEGSLVYDSGDQLEQIIAEMYPENFNETHDENGAFEDRSTSKGPEPEGIALGQIDERTYAFIGLERISGVMIYDVTDPMNVQFVNYVNNRDFAGDIAAGTAGDLGPEGLVFIAGENSPTGTPLLVVANEISGTTTIYEITQQ